MNDNQVILIILNILRSGLQLFGMSDVLVKQAYQRRQTGADTAPTIYLHKIHVKRYGFPGQIDRFNTGNDNFDHQDVIWRVPTFQIDGLVTEPQNPTEATLTASDIVEAAADIMQQPATRLTLLRSRIGIQRITDVRVLYFLDDRERQEQSPSFDFTLSYRFERQSTVQPVNKAVLDVNRVC